jgi:hypothetical protein
MKSMYTLLIIILMASPCYPQHKYTPAAPICGWDSLRSRIIFPELFIRACVESLVEVSFSIDTTGAMKDVKLHPVNEKEIHSQIEETIMKALRSTGWTSEKIDGISQNCTINLNVDFVLTGGCQHHFIIEGTRDYFYDYSHGSTPNQVLKLTE